MDRDYVIVLFELLEQFLTGAGVTWYVANLV
jgi:hypothetical protein